MKQYEIDQLELSSSKLEGNINSVIDITNLSITESYNTIINSADKINNIKEKISVLGDMLTDLKVINGSTGNITNLIDLDVISSKGIEIDEDTITLARLKETLVEFDNKTSLISSAKPLMLLSTDGKEKTTKEIERGFVGV